LPDLTVPDRLDARSEFPHSPPVNRKGGFTLPSVCEILKPAVGPSSSHTLGPMRAGRVFVRTLSQQADLHSGGHIRVALCGSLAHTGKGHLSDLALTAGLAGLGPEDLGDRTLYDVYRDVHAAGIIRASSCWFVFHPEEDVIFDTETSSLPHPNTMRFSLLNPLDRILRSSVYVSIGGGQIVDGTAIAGLRQHQKATPISTREILTGCAQRGETLVDYMLAEEESTHGHSREQVAAHLATVWMRMSHSIDDGLRRTGVLPGPLQVERRAAAMYERYRAPGGTPRVVSSESTRASIYAIAVAEENADGGSIITAPTCGSAGVLPACLRVTQEALDLPNERIHEALLVAGFIAAVAVAKASIAGALVGCQGEIGVASAMAAAAVCYLLGGNVEDQVDRAAETALEHFLGLTCDPVGGLVQIPCIERNAAGAVSALNAANLARISGGRDRVSFDATLEVMHQTGLDLPSRYKETALGGLAAIVDLDRDGLPDLPSFS